jgi:hypothetical protein
MAACGCGCAAPPARRGTPAAGVAGGVSRGTSRPVWRLSARGERVGVGVARIARGCKEESSDRFIEGVVLIFGRGLLVRNRLLSALVLLDQFLGCPIRLVPELGPFFVVAFGIAIDTASETSEP